MYSERQGNHKEFRQKAYKKKEKIKFPVLFSYALVVTWRSLMAVFMYLYIFLFVSFEYLQEDQFNNLSIEEMEKF